MWRPEDRRYDVRGSESGPDRCGWGQERNRDGGSASAAILALPAIPGKFGVRGGGYTMSKSATWASRRPGSAAMSRSTRVINMNHLARARA